MIKQINKKGTEIHLTKRPCAFIYCKQRQQIISPDWPNQERLFESRDHDNAKWTFTSQDHVPTKICPILQAWFLYSVNIYKYDI